MCWFIYKNSKIANIRSDFDLINNSLTNMFYFKKIKMIGSAISYKNRFLVLKRSSRYQFTGLFLNKGNRLKTFKLINYVYWTFLKKFHTLNISTYLNQIINNNNVNLVYGEFISLYNSFTLFKDWSRALIWRVEENTPIIKVISKKNKKKKKKGIKRKKYELEFKYIKKKQRFQVALRWLSLLIKTNSKKLYIGFYNVFIPFLVSPKQSKYDILKKKIYTGILVRY